MGFCFFNNAAVAARAAQAAGASRVLILGEATVALSQTSLLLAPGP